VVGGNAVPRPADTVTLQTNSTNTLTTPASMMASPDNQNIVTLGGGGTAYVYNAASDAYVSAAVLFPAPIQGFFGPLAAGSAQSYLALGGLYTNESLTVLGGSANASTATTGSLRNVVATAPLDSGDFVRLSTPYRAAITTTATSDARPILEKVNIANGSPSLLAVAPENPRFTALSTTRWNIPPRSMVIDSNNVAYIITVSGLSVVPLTPNGSTAPLVAAKSGVVNASDGSANLRVGGFITINGTNLAKAATASSLPTPTVLGGSCVLFNEVAVPLLQTTSGQITAQIPTTVTTGSNVVQVISLATAQSSTPTVVTVLPASPVLHKPSGSGPR
jgi:hypothetical protein